ncbi:MAG: ERCC4 domain-containing protein [Akkermansiaceae bacterium]
MSANPTASNENEGCKQLSPLIAPGESECVHAGGDSEPPLAPFMGVQVTSSPIGCTPQLAPLKRKPEKPTIIIDTREQTPLVFENLASERGTLQSGDYSIAGLEHDFAIERKSVSDLCGSLTRGRERFERELHRLRGFDFARILIVGSPHDVQAQAANSKAVFSSISAFEARYKVPFIWEPSPELAARLIERWSWFFWHKRTAIGRIAGPCPIPSAVVSGQTAAIAAASRNSSPTNRNEDSQPRS